MRVEDNHEKERKRRISDRVISGLNACRFAVVEPLALRVSRARYRCLYDNVEDEPLVSVCVPTYNRGRLLVERSVSSVLSQTYKNLELVVVGHSCTDDTAELLAKIKDSRLRFYNMPRRVVRYPISVENHWYVGGAEPANKALEMARGKWIARVDDDDIWTPDHIEVLLRFAQKGDYEFVSAQYVAERFGTRLVIAGNRANGPYYVPHKTNPRDDGPKIGGVSTWLYRSYLKFFRYNLQCWRKSWNRVWDADLSVRFFEAGVRMGFLEQVVSYILPRPGEETIGLDAYKRSEQEKLEHYKDKAGINSRRDICSC